MEGKYPHTTDAIQDWLNDMLTCMQKGLDKGGKHGSSNNSGTLRQSLAQDHQEPVKVKGGFIKGSISMEEYGGAVDEGRVPAKKSSTPSLQDAILQWVKEKIPTTPGLTSKQQETSDKGLAYVIARKINKDGTKGTGFKSKCINKKSIKKLRENIVDALYLDNKQMIIDAIKK